MTTYAQTTIHSKIAKFERNSDQSLGKVVKGASLGGPQQMLFTQNNLKNKLKSKPISDYDRQIYKEIQILPKTKANINRKMKNKVIPSLTKGDEIILMESSVFPPIYFKKTSMRNVLKQFQFPDNVQALPPNDDRSHLIFQIVSNLFNEITFYVFNILIGENLITQSYYVFFSDSQTIPFTKCCNAPVYIELMNNGSGKILCNSSTCPHSNLAEFLINFEDGKKLWSNITYFADASHKDRVLRNRISRLISNGKYKKLSLVNTVQETSKEIVDLFYKSKNEEKANDQEENHMDYVIEENQLGDKPDPQFDETPFLTAGNHIQRQTPKNDNGNQQQNEQDIVIDTKPMTAEELLDTDDSDVDILKMKIHYLTRNQKDLPKRLSNDLVRNGKVFQSDFDMIKKIDDIMLKQKNNRSTRVSFPKIMEQYRITKHRESKSKSMYRSQKGKNINNQTFA